MSSDPDYLQKILTAAVYDVAIESPLDHAPILSQRCKNQILLKREDMQPVFSFKLREIGRASCRERVLMPV